MPTASRDKSLFAPFVDAIESAPAVEPAADRLSQLISRALPPGAVKDAVSGTWLGHALHPALTDLVIGCFVSATAVDLLAGEDGAAASNRLTVLGMTAYAPTALAGASDWTDGSADARVKRVGIVHAGGNLVALGLYTAALRARRRGRRLRARLLSGAGAGVLMTGGYLGGHLSLRRGIGPDQTVFDPGPDDWRPAADASQLSPGRPLSVVVDETPVLLLSDGAAVHAIHDRCSHRGCSLADGEVDGDTIVCPCHGSRFDLRDGALLRGPATAPQPAFEVRERDGRIEVRRRTGG